MKLKLGFLNIFLIYILFINSLFSNASNCESYISNCVNYNQIKEFYDTDKECNKIEIITYIPTICPIKESRLKKYSSLYGNRYHPIDKKMKFHYGVDISADYGTPIHATATGKVIKMNVSNDGYGNQIEIEHKYGFITKYAHMNPVIVKTGEYIKKGDVIGFVGSTGKSTASHLHYEVIKNGKKIDPLPFCKIEKGNSYYSSEDISYVKEIENEMSPGKKTLKKINSTSNTKRRRKSSTGLLGSTVNSESRRVENGSKNSNKIISAVIHNGNKEIKDGDYVRIRITESFTLSGKEIPKNTFVLAKSKFITDRVELTIAEINVKGELLSTNLKVYGYDGLSGLLVPGLKKKKENPKPEEAPKISEKAKSKKTKKQKKEQPITIILNDNHLISLK